MELYSFSFSEEEEPEVVQKQLEEAYHIFQREAILDNGDPVMCQFHEAFSTYDTRHHNCLGCNFADSTLLIHNFLQTYPLQRSIQYAYSTFIILAYLLVERIDKLFDIIELNKAYKAEHFKVLSEIRRWANFLKHPKAFLLTHHPTFTFYSSPKNRALIENASVVIDLNFVTDYYSDNEQNDELGKKLENKENVLVVFPDVVRLAKDLCQVMHNCVSLIQSNPVYRWILEDTTTFYDYWNDLQGG